jgi:superfamily I DNA/RNA helicase
MKKTAARTIGGPGAGKTHRGMQILEMCLDKVVGDPMKIGFVSFTRAARREASERAARPLNVKPAELEKEGWFRTLHSCAYRLLGVQQGELLIGTEDDNEWLKDVLGDQTARLAVLSADDDYLSILTSKSTTAKALSIWDAARNRLEPFEVVWSKLNGFDERLPPLWQCWSIIGRYEAAKRKDDRMDFCDLLMRYAGRQFTGRHGDPYEEAAPQGDVPDLPVWLHDEAQDMSALTALVFRRISSEAKFVYLLGDHFQSIYGWAGADGSIFSTWPVAKEEVLPVSYRCKSKILERADRLIYRTYPKRDFKALEEGGEVVQTTIDRALEGIEPGQDALVLARTNEYVKTLAGALDARLLPWSPIKGTGGFNAPARAAGVKALIDLRCGLGIDGEGIYRMMGLLPSKRDGIELIVRGWKAKFDDAEYRACVWSALNNLDLFGVTGTLKSLIDMGEVREILEPAAQRMYDCGMKYGVSALGKPTLRLGTIHASKGLEADHVVLLNKIPFPTSRALADRENRNEERRVWYVALTRARERTTIACDFGEQFAEI